MMPQMEGSSRHVAFARPLDGRIDALRPIVGWMLVDPAATSGPRRQLRTIPS